MDNELLEKHRSDPAWAEVIRLYSGLFDTQDERENFILDLAETDILLAAECKTSSVEEEESIHNKIVSMSKKDASDISSSKISVQGFLSLLELGATEQVVNIFKLTKYVNNKTANRNKKNSILLTLSRILDTSKYIEFILIMKEINDKRFFLKSIELLNIENKSDLSLKLPIIELCDILFKEKYYKHLYLLLTSYNFTNKETERYIKIIIDNNDLEAAKIAIKLLNYHKMQGNCTIYYIAQKIKNIYVTQSSKEKIKSFSSFIKQNFVFSTSERIIIEFIIKLDIGQKYTKYEINYIPVEVSVMKLKHLFPKTTWIKLLEKYNYIQKLNAIEYLIVKYPDDNFLEYLDKIISPNENEK